MGNASEQRRSDLAAIHAGKRELGMDDSSYRMMLQTVAGAASAKDLSASDRVRVMEHMRTLGWKRTPRKRVGQHPGKPHNLDREAQLQKIEAQLASMKLSWAYVDAIAKRQWGIEKVAWIRKPQQFSAIIAALHVEQEKRDLLEHLDSMLVTLGKSRADIESELQLKKGWTRNRKTLRRLLDELIPVVDELRATENAQNKPALNPE